MATTEQQHLPGPTSGNEVQRTLSLSLMGGSVAFLALLLAVVWVFAVPHGPYTVRRIQPVLDAVVRRAAVGDALGVHGLYSNAGLRQTPLETVDALVLGNDAFAGAVGVRIARIVPIDGLDALAPRAAIVNAFIRYGDGRATFPLSATLDLEDREWRIRALVVGADGADGAGGEVPSEDGGAPSLGDGLDFLPDLESGTTP